jgi:phenylalanyl-tRNA synthetase beta chain
MRVSLEWLNRYVDLDGESVETLSHALTMVGFEVDGIEQAGLPALNKVVVGEILAYEQHPNADRLSVCQVEVGEGEPKTIVCGAKNFAQNDRVLVALPGAVLPGNFKIKKSKLRGVTSRGMLCSERELGLGDDHAGIAILKDRPEIGTPVNDLYPKGDTVFVVEVTPNRPDALSHLGIARELAAWFERPLRYPEISVNPRSGPEGSLVEQLDCLEPELCPHYRGYNIRGVTVAESPDWLKKSLLAIGLRPINNIVDITNYVLHETGQPLHAFDVSKIQGRRIIIRRARDREKLVTLDDKERKLLPDNLVIADAERGLVVAGVMGTIDAEVDEQTKDVFLESAYFNPVSVRRTSKQLGLSSDSSYRFERGVDPRGAEYAALRCIDLILELGGGELLGPPLIAGEPPLTEKEIEISPNWIRQRTGFHIADSAIVEYLERLELTVSQSEDSSGQPLYRVGIPSFRQDLYRPIDLVEEVVRMHGSDKIPPASSKATATLMEDDPVVVAERAANNLLVGRGFQETVHYTLRAESEIRAWYGHTQADTLAVSNPLASEASHLRTSLIPGLLDCLQLNRARHNEPERIFETGRVFREYAGKVFEMLSVAFVISSEERTHWASPGEAGYYLSSRIILDLLGQMGVEASAEAIEALVDDAPWQKGHCGRLGGFSTGFEAKFGILNLAMTRQWDLENPVLAGSVYLLPEFLKEEKARERFEPFSLQPPAIRDIAILAGSEWPAGKLLRKVRETTESLLEEGIQLESARIFDVYEGEGVPVGYRSIAIKLLFRHPERTLKDKEVNTLLQRLISSLDTEDGLDIRK